MMIRLKDIEIREIVHKRCYLHDYKKAEYVAGLPSGPRYLCQECIDSLQTVCNGVADLWLEEREKDK